MLERMADIPANVVGIRASGTVSADDYEEVLRPAIQGAIGSGEKIRLVYVLGPDFGGYSAGAAWEDLKLGTGYLRDWQRCAVVTDHEVLAGVIRGFGVLMPGEIRVFPVAEEAAAVAWAAA